MRHLSISQVGNLSRTLVDRLGINLVRDELPPGFELYARTPDFTSRTLPAELKAGHYLAEDVWGLIRVLEGALLYALETPNTASVVLTAGDSAVIEPQTLHHFEFVEPGRFFIEFHIPRDQLKPPNPWSVR